MNILIYPNPNKDKITYEKRWSKFGDFNDNIFFKIKDTEVESLSKLYEKYENINAIFIFKDDYGKFIFKIAPFAILSAIFVPVFPPTTQHSASVRPSH